MNDLQKKYSQADENNRKLSEYRPLPPETLKSLREYYRVGLTYTSNALEGNSLTESFAMNISTRSKRRTPVQRYSLTLLPTV